MWTCSTSLYKSKVTDFAPTPKKEETVVTYADGRLVDSVDAAKMHSRYMQKSLIHLI